MSTATNCLNLLTHRNWVFDLDGTLTLPVHDFGEIRTALNVPDGMDILHHLATLPDDQAWPLHQRLDGIERTLITRTAPAPGAQALVSLLAGSGCRLGILTRNTREIAKMTLTHIGLASFFEEGSILGRGDAVPKPHPDGIHKLAGKWGVLPEELVMVGDYLYDLQAGQAAGAATVHVHGSGGSRWPEWTDLCFVSLLDLASHLATGTHA